MDDELQTNPLFVFFQKSGHFDAAAANKLIVVVPHRGALILNKVDRTFLQHHILRQSEFSEQEFVSLSGIVTTFEGDSVVVHANPSAGATRRTLKVVGEELYYDDNFESFKVLKVNFPVVGKVTQKYLDSLSAKERRIGIEKRSLEEHTMLVRQQLGANYSRAQSKMADFGQRFCNSYLMVKGHFADTGDTVRNTCKEIRLFETKVNLRRTHSTGYWVPQTSADGILSMDVGCVVWLLCACRALP
jgi:hypothetical protein